MIWIKIVRLAVSSYHSAGVSYDLFKELSFSAPVMPPWLSGGEAPLLSPCNLSWVLPFTLHYSQPLVQMRMYLQTSRLRLQNNENVAAQVLLYALCEAGKAFCCVPPLARASHTHSPGAGATTDLKQIWSQLTILTTLATTAALMSDQALMPAVESCCVLCSKLIFYPQWCLFATDNIASNTSGDINDVSFLCITSCLQKRPTKNQLYGEKM